MKGKDAWGGGKDWWGMDAWSPYGKGKDAWGGGKEGADGWGKGKASAGKGSVPLAYGPAGKGQLLTPAKGAKGKGAWDGYEAGGKGSWAGDKGQGGGGKTGGVPRPAKAAAGAAVAEGTDIMQDLQDLMFGTISVVEHERGFSRLDCPDAPGDRGVYVHKNVADPSFLAVGETVGFRLHVNGKGQPAASAPLWKMAGDPPAGGEVYFGETLGRVGELDAKGNAVVEGVVDGSQVTAKAAVLRQCGLSTGDIIAFSAEEDKSGQFQLASPCWTCCSPGWLKRVFATEAGAELDEPPAGKRPRIS